MGIWKLLTTKKNVKEKGTQRHLSAGRNSVTYRYYRQKNRKPTSIFKHITIRAASQRHRRGEGGKTTLLNEIKVHRTSRRTNDFLPTPWWCAISSRLRPSKTATRVLQDFIMRHTRHINGRSAHLRCTCNASNGINVWPAVVTAVHPSLSPRLSRRRAVACSNSPTIPSRWCTARCSVVPKGDLSVRHWKMVFALGTSRPLKLSHHVRLVSSSAGDRAHHINKKRAVRPRKELTISWWGESPRDAATVGVIVVVETELRSCA